LPFHYFATNDLIESAHVPLCELAQEQWAFFPSQRVADGTAVHVRSPRSRKCLLPCNLDRRPGSCLMVDGHWRCWPDILATSLVCFEYRRRLSRSHPLSGGISLPLLLPAVPQRRRAPLLAAVSRACAMTTTQARRAMGGRAELESHLPLLELAGRAPQGFSKVGGEKRESIR
jgi:hypothetical protein